MKSDKHLHHLFDSLVLNWWAEASAGQDYARVVDLARPHGVAASLAEARRDIRRRLYLHRLLPTHRAATSEDYARAKMRWLEQWRDQAIS
jgi:hypothetical protein